MTPDERQNILAMARHEFSDYSVVRLKEEYKRKLLLGELNMFDYVLTKGELLVLFEVLIKDKK